MHPLLFFSWIAIHFFSVSPTPQFPEHMPTPPTTYAQLWAKADSLEALNQVDAARKLATQAYDLSVTENNSLQRVRAVRYLLKYDRVLNRTSDSANVAFLKKEIAAAPSPAKEIFQSLLAVVFAGYQSDHRWEIMNRTETDVPSADFQTWSTDQFYAASEKLWFDALSPALKQVPLSEITPILEPNFDAQYRPTLYDLIAFEALDYLSNNANRGAEPTTPFRWEAKDAFADLRDFTANSYETPDTLSPVYRVVRLYQLLSQFHLKDSDPTALYDLEIKRLTYARNEAKGEENAQLYKQSLEKLIKRYPDHVLSATAGKLIAREIMNQGGENALKDALAYLKKLQKDFPKNQVEGEIASMIWEIEQPSIALTTEEVNLPNQPFRALISWKNTPQAHFRIVAVDPFLYLEGYYSQKQNNKLLNAKVLTSWKQDLPNKGDYQIHSSEIKVTALKPGTYALICSNSKSFGKNDIVTFATFQVSSLSWMTRTDEAKFLLSVTNRETGKPVTGATIQAYQQKSSGGLEKSGSQLTTDASGIATFKKTEDSYKSYRFLISQGGEQVLAGYSYFGYYREPQEEPHQEVSFFTDRAIYRPGQEVQFKAIVMQRVGDTRRIKPDNKLEVTLRDVNSQEVAKLSLRTNAYGSASGKFTLPAAGVLTGQFSLVAEGGSKYFRMEEYKRPKFEVSFEPVAGAPKLNETVTATGKAMSYAGAAIGNGEVTWRVVRKARFPYWFWWWGAPPSPSREIAHGTAQTDDDGIFKVEFLTAPDEDIKPSQKPVFTYEITASVTDINGETHDATQQIQAGYISTLLSFNLHEQVDAQDLPHPALTATNLNGQPVTVKGELSFARVTPPKFAMRTRRWAKPDLQIMKESEYHQAFPRDLYADENERNNWPTAGVFTTVPFSTVETPAIDLAALTAAPAGMYKWTLSSQDASGAPISLEGYISLYQSTADLPIAPSWLEAEADQSSYQPGETAVLNLITSEKELHVRYELVLKNQILEARWITLKKGLNEVTVPILEKYRGGVFVQLSATCQNQAFQEQIDLTVPWTNKELQLSWATFRDKMEPGSKESWKLTIRGPKKDVVAAEMVATLYDASLDAFVPHGYDLSLYPNNYASSPWQHNDGYSVRSDNRISWVETPKMPENTPVTYPVLNTFGFNPFNRWDGMLMESVVVGYSSSVRSGRQRMYKSEASPAPVMANMPEGGLAPGERGESDSDADGVADTLDKELETPSAPPTPPGPVQVRTNLQETAFFFPQLETDAEGNVVLNFTMPEALTRWKFLGLAHTQDLEIGTLTGTAVTQKSLMVTPNLPRFFREDDAMTVTAKLDNLTEGVLSGSAELIVLDAFTRQPLTAAFQVARPVVAFDIQAKKATAVEWSVRVPQNVDAVAVQIVARAGDFSDGEENPLPILLNRILVTETMPLSVKGNQTAEYKFEKLLASGNSKTLKSRQLTLEFTSNPAWYAVQALPYLMEYPYECTEQVFSRYYANALATHVANSQPKIKAVFESWKAAQGGNADAFLSNLEKNQDLKSALLAETPWVLNARSESDRKQRVGNLFDLHRMADETQKAYTLLQQRQNGNGAFTWFPGMGESRYMTQLIVTGIGKLNHLGVDNGSNPEMMEIAGKSLPWLDQALAQEYRELKQRKVDLDKNNLSYSAIYHLYTRSFFPDIPLAKGTEEAVNYYTSQATKFWNSQARYQQGMLALTFFRQKNTELASLIVKGLAGSAVRDKELGMYWKSTGGWYWYEAPIETHALLLEAFEEAGGDADDIEEMKIWLLRQKQTQDWKTTRATAEACYALLLTGMDLLATESGVTIKLGNLQLNPATDPSLQAEAGTGYFRKSWEAGEITPDMGKIKLQKTTKGLAWGALHWQYFEQIDQVTDANTSLRMKKDLFRQVQTDKGLLLETITADKPLHVGDKVVVRMELTTDRTLEYVHIKDLRAAGFEPTETLSGYQYKGGLGFYRSIRDASANYFLDYLPQGTHVFEYSLRVTHTGTFSAGIATIQCMYAPEFSAHSAGMTVQVVD